MSAWHLPSKYSTVWVAIHKKDNSDSFCSHTVFWQSAKAHELKRHLTFSFAVILASFPL